MKTYLNQTGQEVEWEPKSVAGTGVPWNETPNQDGEECMRWDDHSQQDQVRRRLNSWEIQIRLGNSSNVINQSIKASRAGQKRRQGRKQTFPGSPFGPFGSSPGSDERW